MNAPAVQYVTTSDQIRVAYAVSGGGTPLLYLPGVFYHVQLAWQYPGLQAWLEALSARFQVIQMDPRGTGMSSRDVGNDHARDHYQRDIEAVVSRLGLQRFMLFALSLGVDLAVDYAVSNPGKVLSLMLGTSGEGRSSAMFRAVPGEDWDAFVHSTVPRDRSREERERMVELYKQASDQKNFLLRWRVLGDRHELERRLASLSTPTLVMHTRGYALTPIEEGMKIAHLSGGRFVAIDGTDPFGDVNQGVRAIEAFMADLVRSDALSGQAADGPGRSDVQSGQSAAGLSGRELEVLRLIAAGKSNPQIAEELVISLNTVQRHVSNILAKTGAANRTEAAGYARDKGLV